MYKKLYIEITNVCNLNCSFCHGTNRPKKFMTLDEFEAVANRVKGYAENYYLHVLGEPLLHPQISEILAIADKIGLPVNITTNGTLIKDRQDILLSAPALKKVSISLHSFESAQKDKNMSDYITNCINYAKIAAEQSKITVFRLWNLDGSETKGENLLNGEIVNSLKNAFPDEWKKCFNGFKLRNYIFLEYGEKFNWPDLNEKDYGDKGFCYGLRSQIAVLADGTVVPCCLDSEGNIPLGNIFKDTLTDIIHSPRAVEMNKGFTARRVTEELCRKCGYANRFKK